MSDLTPLDPDRPRPSAFVEVLAGLSQLIRGEIALARAEAGQAVQALAQAGAELAGALVLGTVGMLCLALAAAWGLVLAGLEPVWALLMVGVVLAVIALGMVSHARALLRAALKASHRPARNIAQDLETLQNMGKADGI